MGARVRPRDVATFVLGAVILVFASSGGAAAAPVPRLAASTAVTAPTSAEAAPTGDLSGWKLTAVQDFLKPAALGKVGSVYGSDMRGYSGFRDTSGHGMYTPDRVLSVSGGILDYYLHTESGLPRVATPVPFGYAGQTYGRYSVRFRSDPLPGYKIAFLLWPSSDRWNEGEIDWPEGNLNGPMTPSSAIKGSFGNGTMQFDAAPRAYSATDSSGWHTATTEWTPGNVRWYWDGKLVEQTVLPAGVPTTNMRLTLQAETQIWPTAAPVASVAGHLQVDWVAQWAYAPGS